MRAGANGLGEEEGGRGAAPSGVDGDDLAAASADQEDPGEAVGEDLEELHVLGGKVLKKPEEARRTFFLKRENNDAARGRRRVNETTV